MSRMNRRYPVLVILALVAGLSAAQVIPAAERLRVTADISRYRGSDDENIHVEIAYAFPEASLIYKPDSAGLSGVVDLLLTVHLKDSLVYVDRWLVPHTIPDTASLSRAMNLIGLYKLQLPPGDYMFKLVSRDRNDPLRRDSITAHIPIRKFDTTTAVLSDIALASIIRQGVKGGLFYKNTLDVVPNVGSMYSEDQKVFYYCEAYSLLAGNDTSGFVVRTNVYDAVGKEIISRDRPKRRVAESSVIVDQFPVKNLRTGSYTMMVSLLDSANKVLTSSGRKLFVYNPTLGVDSSLLASSSSLPMPQFMSMDSTELDREFNWARYEASDNEKTQYKALSGTQSKRKFMSDFWRHRDVGRRDEYLSRVAYANANFKIMTREGYRTDRGRVMIMYGPPDDVERHPSETDTRPYEIWSFNNIQGGVIFVFVLRNAAGDYELVHSTHRNELHDENWDRVGITK
jgi:GWxTD domain-containing protein